MNKKVLAIAIAARSGSASNSAIAETVTADISGLFTLISPGW